MKNALLDSVAGIIILAFTACAPVKFFSDPALTEKSGLKYYTVKPFLTVEKELSTGNVLKASVIYLPDLESPQYMVVRDGMGSRKVDLKLTEGSINTISVATDPKISESIEALASLADKTSEAVAELSSLKGMPSAASTTITELYEIIMKSGITSVRKVEIR